MLNSILKCKYFCQTNIKDKCYSQAKNFNILSILAALENKFRAFSTDLNFPAKHYFGSEFIPQKGLEIYRHSLHFCKISKE